ncbi:hypothetical protein RJ639_024314 [Escallonia herrerae]|uniref:Uncharacterized protein n=1 Tax=Escallonia herrerae TaxID=1293975 RepID=A0AA88V1Y4_9ASTE|nr:hypothetical protein RJ639_024314 [Escallonia herrerae]
MGGSRKHVVMLPFMAQGHFIPFLALAKQIQQRTGCTITIVNTPLNIQYLTSTIAKDSSISSPSESEIRLVALPFNSVDHGLPPNTENTEALSTPQIASLFRSSRSLEPAFCRLISDITVQEGRPPVCIVSDVLMAWANEAAKAVGTVNISFTTGGAYGTAAYMSIWLNLPHRSLGGGIKEEFSLPGFPDSCRFHISQLLPFIRAADGTDEWSRIFQPQLSLSLASSGWLCNTAEEMEPQGLEILRKGSLDKEVVKRVIGVVMETSAKGEDMRKKAVEIGELMRAAVKEEGGHKGSSVQAMDDFLSTLCS